MPVSTPYRQLLLRRDLKVNLPTLAIGEPFFCTDTHELFVGSSGGNVKVNIDYSPAIPAHWSGTPPATIISAIDRLAAAVEGLLGGAIP